MKPTLIFPGLLCAASLFAQSPLSTEAKAVYTGVKINITKAAAKMPEENYNFKPTPEVRSFAQLIGHVADAQYLFCAAVKGEDTPQLGVEKNKTTKAELTAALTQAFTYCDAVYDGMKDSDVTGYVKLFGRDRSKLSVLYFNAAHDNEHYGNIVTYMRLKGLVPPSSEQQQPAPKK